VLWLGGSACAGKTTAARALAAAYGLTLYSCDERFEEHRLRASPESHPGFYRLMDLAPEALWAPPVATQVRDLLRFYEDELSMIVEDLREISGPVIAEGVGLLPALVVKHLVEPHQACWLIATPELRRRLYTQRNPAGWLADCPDPQLAYEQWMARDDEIARGLATEIFARALPYRIVDGDTTETEIVSALARQFRLQVP
jgi:hypothetical protein